jgi:adsorption protein B
LTFVDFFAYYVFFLRELFIFTAIFIIISGVDDLIIDILYWTRTIYRKVFLYSKHKPLDVEQLYTKPERPFAIMVPAWQESDVIEAMVKNTTNTYEYQEYEIFIGVYQNDPETQEKVKSAQKISSKVHLVITREDGPTCKADCLNYILQGIIGYEKENNMKFEGIVMHDAEDVVHRLELKLFNYLIDRKDLMQLPVFSLETPWYQFTAGHYIDEFAECHSKDLLVREDITGVVPSAGVATCFSHRAISALAEQNNNVVFNTDSLTEDYDISFRLKKLGMKQIFLRYGVMANVRFVSPFTGKLKTKRRLEYVATHEYFPNSMRAAIRQKARWILGIVFQQWRNVGWQGNLAMRYILLRDRKAIFTSLATFFAYFLLLNIVLLNVIPAIFPGIYRFPPLILPHTPEWSLIWITLAFLINRILHRMLFTGLIYGWEQALLSIPRMVVSNVVAFLASERALRLFVFHLITRKPLAWNKTDHFYPSADHLKKIRQRFGELLIEKDLITQHALNETLELQKKDKRPIGELLIELKQISKSDLAHALAAHLEVSYEEALSKLEKTPKKRKK